MTILVGTTSLLSTFSWLEPFRPYFILLTLVILAYAWIQKLSNQTKQVDCVCEDTGKVGFFKTKTFLALLSSGALLLLAFPYFSTSMYGSVPSIQNQELGPLQRTTFGISGMTCPSCEAHVDQQVYALQGIAKVSTSYAHSTAVVDYDPTLTTVDQIQQAIEKTGYTVQNSY